MKISFIIPCADYNHKPFRNQPLTALYLLTILEQKFGDSVDVSIIDLRGVDKDNAIYYVSESDIYLYSLVSTEYPETIRIVREIRRFYPNAKHIAGGIHVNIYPEKSLEVFDAIALGEGEYIISDIIRDVSESNLKKVYREDKLVDINLFPYPDRKFLPRSAVADIGLLNGEHYNLLGTNVLFSRGCPFKCDFCTNLIQSSTRVRDPKLIKSEIEYLKMEYGIKGLSIKDDNILFYNYEVSKKTLLTIGETNVKWRGSSRANGISHDIIKLAKESGCIDLAIGIESVSQTVLNNINKRLELEKAKEFLRLLKHEGIGIRLNFIIGLPGEPKDVAKQTIAFIKEVQPSSVFLLLLTPVPGSEIFKNPKKFGIKFDANTPFDKLRPILFGRFDESEKMEMIFEYEKMTPFGKSMSNEEIINNYLEIQSFLRENNLIF